MVHLSNGKALYVLICKILYDTIYEESKMWSCVVSQFCAINVYYLFNYIT